MPTGVNGENKKVGESGELAAAEYLKSHGFSVITRNYAKRFGEIDIIAAKNEDLHFVEVKTSEYYPDTAFSPEIRINKRKIRNLKRICEIYLRETKAPDDQRWQIDVISVILNSDGSARSVDRIDNAVWEARY